MKITKTVTYRCGGCGKSWLLVWDNGTLTNDTLFPLHREAPNRGHGHMCKECGARVVREEETA